MREHEKLLQAIRQMEKKMKERPLAGFYLQTLEQIESYYEYLLENYRYCTGK